MLCNNNLWGKRGICLCLGLLLAVSVELAWGFAGGNRQRPNGEENSRREQLRLEAQESASEISAALTQILKAVNQNQPPDADVIEQATTMLEENRRYAPAYDDPQKAQYMLLQAWADYYNGNLDDAMNWSLRACKTDATSGDAWISQAVFCQLNGKLPLEPRVRRSDPRREQDNYQNRRPRRRVNEPVDNDAYASASEPYGRKGTLEFDLSALRREMLRERFNRIEFQTAYGSKLEYVPGEDTLCMLLWQVKPSGTSSTDSNKISDASAASAERNINIGQLSGDSQHVSLKSQGQYFSSLYEVLKNHPQVTCFSLNTNGLQDTEQVATGMDDDFAHEIMDKPMVFAAKPGSGANAYVGVDAQIPFMLIADMEGVVRYAGPAVDFMPAFILTHLTDIEIPLNTTGQIITGEAKTVDTGTVNPERQRPNLRRRMPPRAPNRQPTDPNRPAADPNAVPPVARSPRKNAAEPVRMTLEEQVKADKLLALAEMEINACIKIRGKSPEQGIEACKKILEQYPGTDYADRARDWLKKVPERYWEKYGIADLLGY